MKEELRSLMQSEIVLLHGSSSKLSKDECVMSHKLSCLYQNMAWKTGHACAKSAGGIVAPPQLEDHQGPQGRAQVVLAREVGIHEAADFFGIEEAVP